MTARIDALEAQFDDVGTRTDTLWKQVCDLDASLTGLNLVDRVNTIGTDIDAL